MNASCMKSKEVVQQCTLTDRGGIKKIFIRSPLGSNSEGKVLGCKSKRQQEIHSSAPSSRKKLLIIT